MPGRRACALLSRLAGAVVVLVVAAFPEGAYAQGSIAERLGEAHGLGWTMGAEDAPVTVIEFTDVSCPYCASFHAGTRAALHDEFVETGKVRWITLSYVSGLYPNSETVFVAAECAGRRGRYDPFLQAAFEARESWLRAGGPELTEAVAHMGAAVGLTKDEFGSCTADAAVMERLETIRGLARAVGVRGTPTWFVDGFPVMGDLPLGYARSFIVARLDGSRVPVPR